jgi:hypothetical protein
VTQDKSQQQQQTLMSSGAASAAADKEEAVELAIPGEIPLFFFFFLRFPVSSSLSFRKIKVVELLPA